MIPGIHLVMFVFSSEKWPRAEVQVWKTSTKAMFISKKTDKVFFFFNFFLSLKKVSKTSNIYLWARVEEAKKE